MAGDCLLRAEQRSRGRTVRPSSTFDWEGFAAAVREVWNLYVCPECNRVADARDHNLNHPTWPNCRGRENEPHADTPMDGPVRVVPDGETAWDDVA